MRTPFFSNRFYTSSQEIAKESLALPSSNTATYVVEVTIKKGEWVYVGRVAPANGRLGLGVQIVKNDTNGVQYGLVSELKKT